jgi:S-DNA-T family DNA segregation ATPase FtsK/SpoIIIE
LPVKRWQGPAVPVQMVKAEAPAEDTKPVTNRDRVLEAVRDGARTGREIADRTGLNKGTVSRELGQLVKAGALRRAEDGAVIAGGAA